MKNCIFTILTTGISLAATAQGVGIEAGANLNRFQYDAIGSEIQTTLRPGFRTGIVAEEAISDQLAFQYGVYYTTKSSNISINRNFIDGSSAVQQKTNGYIRVSHLEIPMSILYHTTPKTGNRFFVGGGPYLGIALGGVISFDRDVVTSSNGNSITRSLIAKFPLDIGSATTDDIKRIDAGLQVQTGYELASGIFTRLSGSYSATDIDPSPDKARNLNLALTIGYMIR